MRVILKNFIAAVICSCSVLFFSCDLAIDNEDEYSVVTVKLILPESANVNGKTWEIGFTRNVDNLSTGNYEYTKRGTCSSSDTVTIQISDLGADSYYLFAIVYMGVSQDQPPQPGDLMGIYGVALPGGLSSPNVNIPGSGEATFIVHMVQFTSELPLSGNLILPAAAEEKEWSVYVDTDYDYSNGCVADAYGVCGASNIVPYGFETVPAGTYHLYGMVHRVSTPGGSAMPGDYYGFIESITIPETGEVVRDLNLTIMTNN